MRTDQQIELLRQRIDRLLAEEAITEDVHAELMGSVALVAAALDEDLVERRGRPPF